MIPAEPNKTISKKKLLELLKTGILFLLILLPFIGSAFHLFQSWWGLERSQEIACVILFIAATLWISEAVPLYVTSFIILLLEIVWLLPAINVLEKKVTKEEFLSPFFSDIILLFLGGFVLSSLMNAYRLDQRVAQWILRKTGDSPAKLLLGMIFISAVFSMWMSNTATAAMMFTILLPIIREVPEENPFSKALALSIPFACNLGGIGTPIGTPANAIAISFLAKKGIVIPFLKWMLITIPLLIVLLFFLWRLLLWLFPPGDLKLEFELEKQQKFTLRQYFALLIFLGTSIGWMTTQFHGLSTGTISLFPIIICFGFHLLKVEDFRSLSWDVLFMLGGGLALGIGLEKCGLTQRVVLLIPATASPEVIFISFACLAAVLTTFISNTATANLMIPIAVSLDSQFTLVVVSIAISCSTSMALPVSTPPNAIAFGSGMLESKNMILPGSLLAIVALILVGTFGYSYWTFLGFS